MTYFELVGITERQRRQRPIGFDFQNRDIGILIPADHLRIEFSFIVQFDFDLVGILDHVVVGHHESVFIDDEAGAKTGLLEFALHFITEKAFEKILERPFRPSRIALELAEYRSAALDGLHRADVDHGRAGSLG